MLQVSNSLQASQQPGKRLLPRGGECKRVNEDEREAWQGLGRMQGSMVRFGRIHDGAREVCWGPERVCEDVRKCSENQGECARSMAILEEGAQGGEWGTARAGEGMWGRCRYGQGESVRLCKRDLERFGKDTQGWYKQGSGTVHRKHNEGCIWYVRVQGRYGKTQGGTSWLQCTERTPDILLYVGFSEAIVPSPSPQSSLKRFSSSLGVRHGSSRKKTPLLPLRRSVPLKEELWNSSWIQPYQRCWLPQRIRAMWIQSTCGRTHAANYSWNLAHQNRN